MAKTKISEYDTDPNNNTDVNGINIAENCSPANINNAIRQLMADLKDWQSGADDKYIVPAGTAAAPSVTFNSDTDTGFYRVGANEIGVAVNGASVGSFSSSGWTGSVTTSAVVPSGSLLMWSTGTAPTGYLLCNGSAVSRTTYATLFAAIGTAYGSGDGSTTFNLTDMRDRMPIGAGTTYAVNASGGSSTTTIALANLPAHDHSITDPGHVHSVQYNFGGASNPGQPSSGETLDSMTENTGSATTGITKTNTTQGSGSAFSNSAMTTISPYRGVYFIIKT